MDFKLDTTGKYLFLNKPSSKNISSGRGTEGDVMHDMKAFEKNIFLLAYFRKRILSEPKMAYVPVPVNNGIYYTGAFPQATLGVYAQWWDSCNWAVDIDDGGNMSIIWMICGSPLSGKNHCQGSDIYGNSRQISVRSFIKLWPNFANIAAEFSRQQKPEQVYTISEVVDILKHGLDEKAFQEEMTRFCIKAKVLADEADYAKKAEDSKQWERAYYWLQTYLLETLCREKDDELKVLFAQYREKCKMRDSLVTEDKAAIAEIRNRFARREISRKASNREMAPFKQHIHAVCSEPDDFLNKELACLFPEIGELTSRAEKEGLQLHCSFSDVMLVCREKYDIMEEERSSDQKP